MLNKHKLIPAPRSFEVKDFVLLFMNSRGVRRRRFVVAHTLCDDI